MAATGKKYVPSVRFAGGILPLFDESLMDSHDILYKKLDSDNSGNEQLQSVYDKLESLDENKLNITGWKQDHEGQSLVLTPIGKNKVMTAVPGWPRVVTAQGLEDRAEYSNLPADAQLVAHALDDKINRILNERAGNEGEYLRIGSDGAPEWAEGPAIDYSNLATEIGRKNLNEIIIDDTLSGEGAAADAKAAGERVIVVSEWASNTLYNKGMQVQIQKDGTNKYYICKQEHISGEIFEEDKWNLITNNLLAIDASNSDEICIPTANEIAPQFNVDNNYSAGDYVYYFDGNTSKLYRFTENYSSGTGWQIAAKKVEAVIGEDIKSLEDKSKTEFDNLKNSIESINDRLHDQLIPYTNDEKPALIRARYIEDDGTIRPSGNTKYCGTDLFEPISHLTIDVASDEWRYEVILYNEYGNIEDGTGYLGRTGPMDKAYTVPDEAKKIVILMLNKNTSFIIPANKEFLNNMKNFLMMYAYTDGGLSQSGAPADAKVVGEAIRTIESNYEKTVNKKINSPTNKGSVGQVLALNNNGRTVWTDPVVIETDQVSNIVMDWLTDEDNRSIISTVQDNSLEYKKLKKGVLYFIVPEAFGAVGDGDWDDTEAIEACIEAAKNIQESLEDSDENGTENENQNNLLKNKVIIKGSGKYCINKNITLSNTTLDLDLVIDGGTIILENNNCLSGRVSNIKWGSMSRDGCAVKIIGTNNLIIDTLFTGSTTNGSAIVIEETASNAFVERCTFDPCYKVDVYVNGHNIHVSHCTFKAHSSETLSSENGYSNAIKISYYIDNGKLNGDNIIIDHCIMGNHYDNAIDAYSGAQRVLITDNIIYTPDRRCVEIKTKPYGGAEGYSDTYIFRNNIFTGKGCIDSHCEEENKPWSLKRMIVSDCILISTGDTGAILFNAQEAQLHGCYIDAGGRNAFSTHHDFELSHCMIKNASQLLTNTDNPISIQMIGCNIEIKSIGQIKPSQEWHISNCNIYTSEEVFQTIQGKLFAINNRIKTDKKIIGKIAPRDMGVSPSIDPIICLIANSLSTTNSETTYLFEAVSTSTLNLTTIANYHTQALTNYPNYIENIALNYYGNT